MNGLSDHDRGELVGIAFADTFRAQEYVLAITGLAAKHKLKLRDVVTLECSDDGTVRVHETIDPAPKQAALSGALWAGLFGLLLGGPVGWAAGAALLHTTFDDATLRRIEDALSRADGSRADGS